MHTAGAATGPSGSSLGLSLQAGLGGSLGNSLALQLSLLSGGLVGSRAACENRWERSPMHFLPGDALATSEASITSITPVSLGQERGCCVASGSGPGSHDAVVSRLAGLRPLSLTRAS